MAEIVVGTITLNTGRGEREISLWKVSLRRLEFGLCLSSNDRVRTAYLFSEYRR